MTRSVLRRLDSIDFLRGVVMVLMALDHARGMVSGAQADATNLAETTAPLFLTRWITHFCAPVFVFLAGTAAYLSAVRGKTKPELARFLWTRGLWLIFLEFTLVRFGWSFSIKSPFVVGQVIWVLGCSMILLAALVHLPTAAVAIFGIALTGFGMEEDVRRSQAVGFHHHLIKPKADLLQTLRVGQPSAQFTARADSISLLPFSLSPYLDIALWLWTDSTVLPLVWRPGHFLPRARNCRLAGRGTKRDH